MLLSLSASCRCRHRLVIVVVVFAGSVVGVSSSLLYFSCRRRRLPSWLLPSALAPCRCCCRWRFIVVIASHYRWRRLFVVVNVGFSLSASRCCLCLVVVGDGVPPRGCFRRILRPVVIVSISVLLSSLASPCHRRSWRLLIVDDVFLSSSSSSLLESRRCWSLVVVGVSSLSAAASLLVAASVGFCVSLLSSMFASLASLAFPCYRRSLAVVVIVGFLLSLVAASASHCCHRRRRRGVLCKILFYTRITMHAITMDLQHQYNKSTMRMEINGRNSCTGNSWYINIRYFFITDQENKGGLRVMYCPRHLMLADYFTKPLHGALFFKFREKIM